MTNILPIDDKLYVITMISNPRRFKTRYKLYKDFAKYIKHSGAILYTVEIGFGDREFQLVAEHDETIIRLQTNHELWHKENALNIALSRLPFDWKYVAWIDADVSFARPDWVQETIHMLQHHPVIQPWSEAYDLSPKYESFNKYRSFGWCNQNKDRITDENSKDHLKLKNNFGYSSLYWHSGYAWAATRTCIDNIGGLIDFSILGAADHHMAHAFVGNLNTTPKDIHPKYNVMLKIWADIAYNYVKGDVGYVDGALYHYWHGKKSNRKYIDRWDILINNEFNPETDIVKDFQGLYKLTDKKPKLKKEIQDYFNQRNEDGIDF